MYLVVNVEFSHLILNLLANSVFDWAGTLERGDEVLVGLMLVGTFLWDDVRRIVTAMGWRLVVVRFGKYEVENGRLEGFY